MLAQLRVHAGNDDRAREQPALLRIGGKGVVTLTGTLPDVQAAIAAGRADAQKRGLLARAVVIPRMHPQLREHLV